MRELQFSCRASTKNNGVFIQFNVDSVQFNNSVDVGGFRITFCVSSVTNNVSFNKPTDLKG